MMHHSIRWVTGISLFGLAFLVIGFGLTGSVSVAAPPQLIPRVFLPLQLRDYESEPPAPSPFGISPSQYLVAAESTQTLNLAISAGIKHSRVGVDWDVVEPTNTTPDHYNWGPVDSAINPLLAQGIEPYVLVGHSPAWAASTNCGPLYNPNDYAELIGALAARYPQVKYWGVYNEVDGAVYSTIHGSSGGCFGEDDLDGNGNPDYADYAELIRLAWRAIHTANPNAQMSFANLAFDNFTPESQPPDYAATGGCCFNYHFLDNLLGYMSAHPLPPGEKYGDVLGFNNYLYYDLSYWETKFPQAGIGSKAHALREIEASHGFDFPLVITEMSGWASYPAPGGVPAEVQARELAQMYAQVVYYNINLGMWWTWDDYPDDCGGFVECDLFKFGMVDANLLPKPSYFAFKNLIAQLRDYKPTDARITSKYVNLGFRHGGQVKRFVYAKSVPWNADPAPVRVKFRAQTLRVTDMFGKSSKYSDDGSGKIKLKIGANPVYVEINP